MAHAIVGDRSGQAAIELMDDLRARLANRVQLTTDGHRAYLGAVEGAFGGDVDYAQVIKMYGQTPGGAGRYSPAECTGIKKLRIEGNPDLAKIGTPYVEVHKKVANHAHMLALYTLFYNFIRSRGKLRMTPAMDAGSADTFLGFEDVLARIDAKQPPKVRGPYKPRYFKVMQCPCQTCLARRSPADPWR